MSLKEKTLSQPKHRCVILDLRLNNNFFFCETKYFYVTLVVTSEDKLHSGSDVTEHQLNYKSRAADASREVTTLLHLKNNKECVSGRPQRKFKGLVKGFRASN